MSMSYQTYHRAPSFLRRIVAAVAAARVSRGARHIAADTNLGVARPYSRLSHIAPPFIRICFRRQRRLPVSSHNHAVARLCPRIVLGALGEMPAASVRARIDAQAEIARLLGVCPRLLSQPFRGCYRVFLQENSVSRAQALRRLSLLQIKFPRFQAGKNYFLRTSCLKCAISVFA